MHCENQCGVLMPLLWVRVLHSHARYEKLLQMYRSHGTGKEVARIRSTAERVIRENYY